MLSDSPAGQSAFKVGDVVSLTLTMNEALTLGETTGSKVVIAGKDFLLDKPASTTAGNAKLVFKYTVKVGDNIAPVDFDIDNPSSDLTLNNVTDVAGNVPVFTATKVELGSSYIEETIASNNPFYGINVGGSATPTLADIDGDGDLDLIVGKSSGTFYYYKNTGTTLNPIYVVQTGDNNPFKDIDVGFESAPTLADIDGDGDLDLVTGQDHGELFYYKNTDTTAGHTNPIYTKQTEDSNPFENISVKFESAPILADIDGDGDLDLIVGESGGTLYYYKNTDTTSGHTNPTYTVQTGVNNPFEGIDVGSHSTPTLADIDDDGDLDLVIGKLDGKLFYYKNTDTTSGHTNPTYMAQTGNSNPFKGIDVGDSSSSTLVDINGNGDLDLVIGERDGTLKYYYNQQPFSVDTQAPTLSTTNQWTLSNIPLGQSAFTVGDVISLTLTMNEALTLGDITGSKVVIANKDFVLEKPTSANADDTKLVFNYTVKSGDNIATADFDIDNPSSDITLNNVTDAAGNAPVFTATKIALHSQYTEQTVEGYNPFHGINAKDNSAPTLADIDSDGDLDLVIGEKDGNLNYYENTDTTVGHTNPTYTKQTGGNNPFKNINVGDNSAPTLADIDGDGDLDLVIGEGEGKLSYYKNTDTTVKHTNPTYTKQTGGSNPFKDIDVGIFSTPTLADIDGDGDLDLVIGEGDGKLLYYKNTDTTAKHTNPTYINQTGGSNPFKDIDVGDLSKLTLADIDDDGDLDLVIGELYGTLHYYKNTDTTTGHTNPTYTVQTGSNNPFEGVNVGSLATPTLADINSDGNLDLVIGVRSGTLKYYYNQFFSVDAQVPTVDNITRNTDSNLLIINFNESLNPAAPDKSAFTVTGKTITSTAISDNVLTLTLDSLSATEVVTFSYTKPSSGNTLKDTLGNETPNLINYHIGGSAADTITGSNAADFITGNGGNDILTGGEGNNTLKGGEGNDRLTGGDGNDILIGGVGGFDVLIGGSGNDILSGGYWMTGGEGNDIFDYDIVNPDVDKGHSTIYDFSLTEDKLDLSDFLKGITITASNLSRYMAPVLANTNDTQLYIDVDGEFTDNTNPFNKAELIIQISSQTDANTMIAALKDSDLSEYILG
ncbi:MAG: type I secretion C-terminal target domain-containing protein [Gammaproteobacteria bacterium]|nr:type I secretion C-terminal target domain-containing protein [Gammaproteobacteria bacterium]